jgi:hypothetical protein
LPFLAFASRLAVVKVSIGVGSTFTRHALQIRLMVSNAVRFPQVRHGMGSEVVGRRLAGTGWLALG